MTLKIDLEEDKNLVLPDPKATSKKQVSSNLMMDEISKTPEAAVTEAHDAAWPLWLNSEPLVTAYVDDDGVSYLFAISEAVRKKALLLHFWDYALLPSVRSLVYIKEWHRRYSSSGLAIIGVHAPMFEFGKDRKNILDAVHRLGITFPVVMDNDFLIWRSLENRYWPRQVLLNAEWNVEHDSVGDGNYEEFERSIQRVLRSIHPGLACPPLLKQKYVPDERGLAVFFGHKRNPKFGNTQVFGPPSMDIEAVLFKDDSAAPHVPGLPYIDGMWVQTAESIYTSSGNAKTPYKGSAAYTMDISGKNFSIVMRSRSKTSGDLPQAVRLKVSLNGKPVPEEYVGQHLNLTETRQSQITVRDPGLYQVLKNLEPGHHTVNFFMDEDAADALELFAVFLEEV